MDIGRHLEASGGIFVGIWRHMEAFWKHFGEHLEAFLEASGGILEAFWWASGGIWMHLDAFWWASGGILDGAMAGGRPNQNFYQKFWYGPGGGAGERDVCLMHFDVFLMHV